MEKLGDHFKFHKAFHTLCKFCLHLIETIPNFNFWFLSSSIRGVHYNGASREHFMIKNLVVNCNPPDWPFIKNEDVTYMKLERYVKRKQELGLPCLTPSPASIILSPTTLEVISNEFLIA